MEKSLAQSFVVFWSVLTKLWSYKFTTGFIYIYLLFLWKKFFYTVYGLFDHFSWTFEVTKFWMNKSLIVAYM